MGKKYMRKHNYDGPDLPDELKIWQRMSPPERLKVMTVAPDQRQKNLKKRFRGCMTHIKKHPAKYKIFLR